jgi:hypothetical protein
VTHEVDPTLPEVVQRFLVEGGRLEEIRLDARGDWWHQGGKIANRRIVALFSRSVNRTLGGTWVLEVGRFTYPIEVEDTPFFVESFDVDGKGVDEVITMTLVGGEVTPLDTASLRYDEGLGISCGVRAGRFRARWLRDPYHDLADRLVEVDGEYGLVIAGRRVPL